MERDEHSLSIEFYDLSPDGEEIRRRDPHLIAYEHPGRRTLRVVFVDSDGNGGPGPCSLAWDERLRKLDEERAPRERGDGRRVRRSRVRETETSVTDSVPQGLKPWIPALSSARLKSCPDTSPVRCSPKMYNLQSQAKACARHD